MCNIYMVTQGGVGASAMTDSLDSSSAEDEYANRYFWHNLGEVSYADRMTFVNTPGMQPVCMTRRLQQGWMLTQESRGHLFIFCYNAALHHMMGVARMTSPPVSVNGVTSFSVEWLYNRPMDAGPLSSFRNSPAYLHSLAPREFNLSILDSTHGEEVDPCVGERLLSHVMDWFRCDRGHPPLHGPAWAIQPWSAAHSDEEASQGISVEEFR